MNMGNLINEGGDEIIQDLFKEVHKHYDDSK